MKQKILKNSLKKIISPVIDEFCLCTFAYCYGYRVDDLTDDVIKSLYDDEYFLSYVNDIKSLVKKYEELKKG